MKIPELGITGIIAIWLLRVIDLFVASDSELAINVSGEAGHFILMSGFAEHVYICVYMRIYVRLRRTH